MSTFDSVTSMGSERAIYNATVGLDTGNKTIHNHQTKFSQERSPNSSRKREQRYNLGMDTDTRTITMPDATTSIHLIHSTRPRNDAANGVHESSSWSDLDVKGDFLQPTGKGERGSQRLSDLPTTSY